MDPFSLVTGISAIIRRMIPARYPMAIPLDEMRDVAAVRALEYSALASTSVGGVSEDNKTAFSESSVSSESPVKRGTSATAAAA